MIRANAVKYSNLAGKKGLTKSSLEFFNLYWKEPTAINFETFIGKAPN